MFDLSGDDLNVIQEVLRRAQKAGMVKFKRIIFEARNNAVHVEVESISPKALNVLGQRKSSQGSSPASSGAGSSPQSENDQRRSMLQQLQDLHDSEPDPAKKIDYDRSRRNLLDPAVDSERINALGDEIKQHQVEAQQLAKEDQKKRAIDKVSQALREDRFEDAEREAAVLAKKFPGKETKDLLVQIKTRRLLTRATDALEKSGCGGCQEADQLINSVLKLYPNHDGARMMREEVDACLEQCRSKRNFIILLGLLIFAVVGSLIGWYFWPRSGTLLPTKAVKSNKWILEGIDGACNGQIFPLDKEEIIIGSKGPPNGVADIVICDAQWKISRRHCTIMQNGKQLFLVDESTNGTKINDQEIVKGVPAEIRQGDRISLADEATLLLKPESI